MKNITPKITTLKIWEKNISFHNEASNTKAQIYDILLSRNWNPKISYLRTKNLKNTQEIILQYPNWKEIKLPEYIKNNLLKYIQTQNNINKILWKNKHFDCANFAHFLHWVDYNDNTFNTNKWNFIEFKIDNLKIGDIVISGIKNYNESSKLNIEFTDNAHFSIYLWKWFYLWKAWTKWIPIVYNIEWLKESYPFKDSEICIVRKKEDL